jgi:PTH2 family peptidyl-tRNA hydrolase
MLNVANPLQFALPRLFNIYSFATVPSLQLVFLYGDMKVIITGFGPFEGCSENPSSAIARESVLILLSRDTRATCHADIPVSLPDVRIFVDSLHKDASADPRVMIHLGVAAKLSEVHVECCAVNEATFRVADNSGLKPAHASLIDADEFGAVRHSRLMVDDLVETLRTAGYSANTSSDAGRFLCNALYYFSLAASGHNSYTIFVHVPPLSVMPLERTSALVADLAGLISNDVAHGRVQPFVIGAAAAGPTRASHPSVSNASKSGAVAPPPTCLLSRSLIDLGFERDSITQAVFALGSDATVEAAVDFIVSGASLDARDVSPALPAESPERVKLVIVLRSAESGVVMSTGKAAAQACHAALKALRAANAGSPMARADAAEWESLGEPIVVLRSSAGEDGGLRELLNQARAAGVPAFLVRDAGKTQVTAGSITALSIGPAREGAIDALTGALKLF